MCNLLLDKLYRSMYYDMQNEYRLTLIQAESSIRTSECSIQFLYGAFLRIVAH